MADDRSNTELFEDGFQPLEKRRKPGRISAIYLATKDLQNEVAQALNGAFLKVKRTLISTRSLLAPHAPLPRQGIPQNGIWLCQNCAKLVDNDSHRYTVELLQEWKQRAEAAALNEVEASLLTKVPSRKTLQTLRSPTEKSGYRKNATTICLKSW